MKCFIFTNNFKTTLARLLILAFISLSTIGGCNNSNYSSNNKELTSVILSFIDITNEAGLNYKHGYKDPLNSEPELIAGGVASGDFDNDGWIDLYVVRGDIGPNLLFRNLKDGTFEEVGTLANLDLTDTKGSGPTFADFDGNGTLDLIIGGIDSSPLFLFSNNGDSTFSDVTVQSGLITKSMHTFSAAFGDYDLDGDLDLFLTHWLVGIKQDSEHLWRNNGNGTFTDVSLVSGISPSISERSQDFTFTPNFADINNDGHPDILVAADFLTSQIFINNTDGTFTNTTTPNINDENGMGSTFGDYDNDGDLDWFVSSIYDPDMIPDGNWGITGNRLYKNLGDGTFENVTLEAGVEHGYWGWGSCFADFNNDGNLDIFHVNGFGRPPDGGTAFEFFEDPSRLFLSNGDGTFSEMGAELGIADTGQGRGVVCFDFDRDGDIDIFIANNDQEAKLYRNVGGNDGNFLNVKLNGLPPNTQGIGSRVIVKTNDTVQIRELRAGSNFVSQDPAEAHFGIGDATIIDELEVQWLDGKNTILNNVGINQFLTINHPDL